MATVTATPNGRKPRAVKPAHGTAHWLVPLAPGGVGLLQINNGQSSLYAVTRLGQGGYRLMKQSDGEIYDLDTADPEHWKCSCPDFVMNRDEGRKGDCKHAAAVRAAVAHLSKSVKLPKRPECSECGGNGATPADDSPTAAPVRCPECRDRPRFRSAADQARNAPEEFGTPDDDTPF